jgi:hypothetical protein
MRTSFLIAPAERFSREWKDLLVVDGGFIGETRRRS